jgi:hypothetical protein
MELGTAKLETTRWRKGTLVGSLINCAGSFPSAAASANLVVARTLPSQLCGKLNRIGQMLGRRREAVERGQFAGGFA